MTPCWLPEGFLCLAHRTGLNLFVFCVWCRCCFGFTQPLPRLSAAGLETQLTPNQAAASFPLLPRRAGLAPLVLLQTVSLFELRLLDLPDFYSVSLRRLPTGLERCRFCAPDQSPLAAQSIIHQLRMKGVQGSLFPKAIGSFIFLCAS